MKKTTTSDDTIDIANNSGCRRPFGEGKGFCNAKKQDSCSRPSSCLCGLTPPGNTKPLYDAKGLAELLLAPETDMAAAIAWWGAMCTCPIDSLDDSMLDCLPIEPIGTETAPLGVEPELIGLSTYHSVWACVSAHRTGDEEESCGLKKGKGGKAKADF